jgi:hypothetical protein
MHHSSTIKLTALWYKAYHTYIHIYMIHRFTGFFWTFPSSGNLETRTHNISETGSVSVLR